MIYIHDTYNKKIVSLIIFWDKVPSLNLASVSLNFAVKRDGIYPHNELIFRDSYESLLFMLLNIGYEVDLN